MKIRFDERITSATMALREIKKIISSVEEVEELSSRREVYRKETDNDAFYMEVDTDGIIHYHYYDKQQGDNGVWFECQEHIKEIIREMVDG